MAPRADAASLALGAVPSLGCPARHSGLGVCPGSGLTATRTLRPEPWAEAQLHQGSRHARRGPQGPARAPARPCEGRLPSPAQAAGHGASRRGRRLLPRDSPPDWAPELTTGRCGRACRGQPGSRATAQAAEDRAVGRPWAPPHSSGPPRLVQTASPSWGSQCPQSWSAPPRWLQFQEATGRVTPLAAAGPGACSPGGTAVPQLGLPMRAGGPESPSQTGGTSRVTALPTRWGLGAHTAVGRNLTGLLCVMLRP